MFNNAEWSKATAAWRERFQKETSLSLWPNDKISLFETYFGDQWPISWTIEFLVERHHHQVPISLLFSTFENERPRQFDFLNKSLVSTSSRCNALNLSGNYRWEILQHDIRLRSNELRDVNERKKKRKPMAQLFTVLKLFWRGKS